MLCSVNEIINCLKKEYDVTVYGVFPESIRALKKLPRNTSEFLSSDTLYACTANDISAYSHGRLSGIPLLCTVGLDQSCGESILGQHSIILLRGVYLPDVLMHLAGIMFDLGMKESPLSEVRRDLLLCKDVDSMMKKAYEHIKLPIFFTTPTLKIISHSSSIEINPIMEQYADGYGFSAKLRQASSRAETVAEGSNNPDHHFRWLDEQWQLLSYPLFEKNSLSGYMLVFSRSSVPSSQQLDICILLRNILENELPRLPSAPMETEESFIESLIHSKVSDEDAITEVLARLQWKPKKVMHILVLSLNGLLPTKSLRESRRLLSDACDKRCRVYALDSGIIMLYEGEDRLFSSEPPQWLTELGSFLAKGGLCAGISGPFSHFSDFGRAFTQASISMQTGAVLNKQVPLFFYEDMAVYHMMELAANTLDLTALMPAGFNDLVELDKKENKELIKTLAVYLECGRSISLCAEMLFLHANTIKYRIKQISEILHCDFKDGSAFFRTALAVKLLMYVENCQYLDHPYSQLQNRGEHLKG